MEERPNRWMSGCVCCKYAEMEGGIFGGSSLWILDPGVILGYRSSFL